MKITICKQGYEHKEFGKNCQDVVESGMVDAGTKDGIKPCRYAIVCDGCGSTPYSEIGARLFIEHFKRITKYVPEAAYEEAPYNIAAHLNWVMDTFLDWLNEELEWDSIPDFASFSVLFMLDTGDNIYIVTMGDGYVYSKINGEFEIISLDPPVENTPIYPLYMYLPEDMMTIYKRSDVHWNHFVFTKSDEDYEECVDMDYHVRKVSPGDIVGIATDGIRFALEPSVHFPQYEVEAFREALGSKLVKVSRMINKYPKNFKDDVGIAMMEVAGDENENDNI